MNGKGTASASRIDEKRLQALAGGMALYRDEMICSLSDLCAIPSVYGNPTADAPYGEETKRALLYFLDLGQHLGFRTVNLDNRAGYAEFGEGDHLVAALCHLDVVPAGDGWETDPFTPVLLDDRLVARGASDDKGPAIAVLYAMKDLLDHGFKPKGRIRLIVGLDEERGSSCMAHYVQVEELPDAGFSPDATFPAIYAEKGIVWVNLQVMGSQPHSDAVRLVSASGGESPNMIPGRCDLTFALADGRTENQKIFGKPGHASMPWAGENAISKAMNYAEKRLNQVGARHPFVSFYQSAVGQSWKGEGLDLAVQDESGPLTFNAGRLILDENGAVLTADIRYPVHQSFDSLMERMSRRVSALGAEIKVANHIQPLYLPPDSSLVQTLTAIFSDLTGMDATPMAIGGGTYARTMPNVIAFGGNFPGEPEMAHQAGEFLKIDHLLAMSTIDREALRALSKP